MSHDFLRISPKEGLNGYRKSMGNEVFERFRNRAETRKDRIEHIQRTFGVSAQEAEKLLDQAEKAARERLRGERAGNNSVRTH